MVGCSNPLIFRRKSTATAFALMVSVACVLFTGMAHSATKAVVTKVNGEKHAGRLLVAVNKSEVLKVGEPFANLLVGNPKIADVVALTNQSIYILGKGLGTTSLSISDKNKNLIAVMDVVVTSDIEGLKSRLYEVMPEENIEVRESNGSIILSGVVSSGTALANALEVAKRYTPEPATVVNLLTVKGSQQVMLAVRFAEVARTVVKDLGLNTSLQGSKVSITTGDAAISGLFKASSFLAGTLGPIGVGTSTLSFLFDALEEKGVVKTLAEPNLIALSGDTASFLAGGEFPVPVARDNKNGDATITVEFKEFGVALAFTPTVLSGGLINMEVAPEVSKIDRANSVTVSGFNIPGLTTRRAKTTVELHDGQSFAIAGLIQSDFEDTVRQIPGIGDAPILSGLFRSTDFQRGDTELVIIVTPHLVKPASPGQLALPTDGLVPPSDTDMFLYGRTDGEINASTKKSVSPTLQGAGGIQGTYGHILK